jgi:hypothetical protein
MHFLSVICLAKFQNLFLKLHNSWQTLTDLLRYDNVGKNWPNSIILPPKMWGRDMHFLSVICLAKFQNLFLKLHNSWQALADLLKYPNAARNWPNSIILPPKMRGICGLFAESEKS